MSKGTQIVMALWLCAVIAVACFPPWRVLELYGESGVEKSSEIRFELIFDGLSYGDRQTIAFDVLAVELILVTAAALLLRVITQIKFLAPNNYADGVRWEKSDVNPPQSLQTKGSRSKQFIYTLAVLFIGWVLYLALRPIEQLTEADFEALGDPWSVESEQNTSSDSTAYGAKGSGVPKWSEVVASQEYQAMSSNERLSAQHSYWNTVIVPSEAYQRASLEEQKALHFIFWNRESAQRQ